MSKVVYESETGYCMLSFITHQVDSSKRDNFKKPSCFNQSVHIKRYKVTVEEVEESRAVLIDRLVVLYCSTTNHYEKDAIQRYAKKEFDIQDFETYFKNYNDAKDE
jgi:hypothetical protein